jgi:hypothetical protein
MQIETAKDLTVYKLSFRLAMEGFRTDEELSTRERYALTSQIRRPLDLSASTSAKPGRSGDMKRTSLANLQTVTEK